jgi:ribosomal protein S21
MNTVREKGNRRKVSVVLRDGKDAGSLERSLRELKRKLKKDGFYKELRRREYFISPSEEKKLKKRRRKSISGEELG